MPLTITKIPEETVSKGLTISKIPESSPKEIKISRMDTVKDSGVDYGQSTSDDVDFENMNLFFKTLDIMGRPGYAVKSGAAEIQKEYQNNLPFDAQRVIDAMGKGFTGKERMTANELYKRAGVEGVPFLGFATEVATDPVNLAGGAIFNVARKGISIASKGVNRLADSVPLIQNTIQKSKELVSPAINEIDKLFVTKSGIPELADKIDFYLSKRKYLKGKELQFGQKIRNVINNTATKYKKPVEEIEKNIISSIENPNLANNFDRETGLIANLMRNHFSDMLTNELKAGLPITSLKGNSKVLGYFPRIAKNDVVKYLRQAKIGKIGVWNPKLANAVGRKTGDFTLEEFNQFAKDNGIAALGGRSVEQFFLQNPAQASFIRGSRSAKAITSAEFLQDISRDFGKTVDAPNYFMELPEAFTKNAPYMKGLKFDPDVANEILRVSRRYLSPEQPHIFLRMFDDIQNAWKVRTLVYFPKYHIRNLVGNIWNNYLADVNPVNYAKAQAIQMYNKHKGSGGILEKTALMELDRFKISPDKADEIIKNAEQTNILHQGQYGGDIEFEAGQELARKSKNVLARTENFFIEKGKNLGRRLENNSKLAHFIDRLDKGDDVASAALSTKKYLFDYADLTDFERNVMKRIFPFYTWTRKNVPLQLKSLYEKTEKFIPIATALRNRDYEALDVMKISHPYLYEKLPIEIKSESDVKTYIPLEGLIPAADLVKLVRPQEIVQELLSPYIKTPVELAMNKSMFTERDIENYSGETQELLRMSVPVKIKYALTTILPQARLLNTIDKIVKNKQKKEKLTTQEQIIEQTLTSTYKIPIEDMKRIAILRLKRKINDLEDGLYKTKKYGREDEKQRIKRTIKETVEIIKGIK